MEKTLQCPKCHSTEIEIRDHDKLLRTTGGVLMTAAGTTAGTVGGAATGASVGARTAAPHPHTPRRARPAAVRRGARPRARPG